MSHAVIQAASANRRLTDAQIRHYHDEGFVILGKILDDRQLEAIRADEAMFRVAGTDIESPLVESAGKNANIFRSMLHDHSPIVREIACHGQHLDMVAQLLGNENVLMSYNQMVTKLPEPDDRKGQFPWHQDNGYSDLNPGTNLTVWIALDDVDEQNGCVWIAPRLHRNGVLPHSSVSEQSWHLQMTIDGNGIPARLKAGEAVAFTGYTPHRSLGNRTQIARRAFFMGYADPIAVELRTGQPVRAKGTTWMARGRAPITDWAATRG